MIVHLVRHGETSHNRDGLGLGRADVALTERGERQALAAGARLALEPISAIYTSPLQRCVSTARAIAGERGIPLEVRDELIELDVGETEGMTFADMRERFPGFLEAWAGGEAPAVRMPGGESLLDVDTRLAPFVEELRAQGEGQVAVVTHNFVLRLFICRALNTGPAAFRAFAVDLASLSTVVLREQRGLLRRLNDCCHLELLESGEPAS